MQMIFTIFKHDEEMVVGCSLYQIVFRLNSIILNCYKCGSRHISLLGLC